MTLYSVEDGKSRKMDRLDLVLALIRGRTQVVYQSSDVRHEGFLVSVQAEDGSGWNFNVGILGQGGLVTVFVAFKA